MVNAIDRGNFVSVFELQSRYYVAFRRNTLSKGTNPLIGNIVQLLFFYKDSFGIK